MANGHKEGKKSSPALRHLGSEKVRQDSCPQNPVRHHVKAPHATGVKRGHTWSREVRKTVFSVGLEGGRMIDQAQYANLFYDLVSRSNHKPEILFHLPSQD